MAISLHDEPGLRDFPVLVLVLMVLYVLAFLLVLDTGLPSF